MLLLTYIGETIFRRIIRINLRIFIRSILNEEDQLIQENEELEEMTDSTDLGLNSEKFEFWE